MTAADARPAFHLHRSGKDRSPMTTLDPDVQVSSVDPTTITLTGPPGAYTLTPPPPLLALYDGVSRWPDRPRRLLTLNVVDGRLVAEYDPADLSEAARILFDEVLRIAAQSGRTFTTTTTQEG